MHKLARLTPLGRLRMVRRLEAGARLRDVAVALDLSTTSVQRWWRRYQAEGTAGLSDRSSRPPRSPRALPTCPTRAPAGTRAFQPSLIHDLLGWYELTTIRLSPGHAPAAYQGRLLLATPDSLRHIHSDWGRGYRRADPPVGGIYSPSEGSPLEVFIESDLLYVGCVLCLDDSPYRYQAVWVADRSFGGTWDNPQTGGWQAYDRSGRKLRLEGYSCARRQETSASGWPQ